MKAGVTLNPHTPVSLLEDILQDVDLVMLMSVNPGYGGQHFIPHSVEKVARLREMIDRKGLQTLIEVDGGVNLETGKQLLAAGADVLVAGNFVFKSPDVRVTFGPTAAELATEPGEGLSPILSDSSEGLSPFQSGTRHAGGRIPKA